jgi:hypothetical protein
MSQLTALNLTLPKSRNLDEATVWSATKKRGAVGMYEGSVLIIW